MRSGVIRGSNEEEDYVGGEQHGGASGNQNTKDGKDSDSKASATRSKHSVTEKKRRSKINERFQQLRDLIPHSDQKRDTASFLLEVIEYVQYLQGEVQKYEGPYQAWSSEPTKLMPWRNSHWRTQNIAPQPMGNGIGAGSAYAGKFNETSQALLLPHTQEFSEPHVLSDSVGKAMDQHTHTDLLNAAMSMPMPMQGLAAPSIQDDTLVSHQVQRPVSDAQSADPSLATGALSHSDDLMIEGGTVSISSAYSQGLLNTLTESLQRAGVDLSQANISVQIDLGKRANRGTAIAENFSHLPASAPLPSSSSNNNNNNNNEDLEERAQKRLKTQE